MEVPARSATARHGHGVVADFDKQPFRGIQKQLMRSCGPLLLGVGRFGFDKREGILVFLY